MRITWVFGPTCKKKNEYVAMLAWDEDAIVLRTQDYDGETVSSRIECVIGCIAEQHCTQNNVVIDAEMCDKANRMYIVESCKMFCDHLKCCKVIDVVGDFNDEGWDDVWVNFLETSPDTWL